MGKSEKKVEKTSKSVAKKTLGEKKLVAKKVITPTKTAKATVKKTVAPKVVVSAKKPARSKSLKLEDIAKMQDADILSMPESAYMNAVQMTYFRIKLLVLKKEILDSAGKTTEHLRDDSSAAPDPTDRATIEEEHAIELRTRDRERKLLKKIDQALARIESGDYGYCDETGEAIGLGRLLARPTANLTLEAQQRRELKQKMYGD